MARAVQYVKHGDPKEVLRLVEPSSFRHLTRGISEAHGQKSFVLSLEMIIIMMGIMIGWNLDVEWALFL